MKLIRAENGFFLAVYSEEERGKARYYIAKDEEEVERICQSIADELKNRDNSQ